jgi:hypothetical protein
LQVLRFARVADRHSNTLRRYKVAWPKHHGRPAQPHDQQSAGRYLGDHGGCAALIRYGLRALHHDCFDFAVPNGTTTFNYIDVFVNAALGAVQVTDANALRAAGASWNVPGSVTANVAPAAGRVLYGNVRVLTDTNIQVGSGDVIVESVQ